MPEHYKKYVQDNYIHLKDEYIDFLKAFDAYPLKEQWVRIILLNEKDYIKENVDGTFQVITGYATGGSISVNGKSALRRTGSLQLVATEENYRILDTTNALSINTRFAIEIGFTNPKFNKDITSDILWFPCGVFVATGASISRNLTSWNISLQFKDKMALLNGELGGKFPSNVELHKKDVKKDNGDIVTEIALVSEIITNMLLTYGKENATNINITVPKKAQSILRWNGSVPLYMCQKTIDESTQYHFTTDITEAVTYDTFTTYQYGDDIGREWTSYTYPAQTLEAKAGESVMSVLEKMIKVMGNYECYYNTYGEFIFKEIDNSLYQTGEEPKSKYDFTSTENGGLLISGYNNNPQYGAIKNDLIILGETESKNIFYHFAFDKIVLDRYTNENQRTAVKIYKDDSNRYCWGNAALTSINGIVRSVKPQNLLEFIYLQAALNNTSPEAEYKAEVIGFVPDMIDLNLSDEQRKIAWESYNPGDGQYWLELISTEGILPNSKSLDIADLGRRTEIISQSESNCIAAPSIPNLVINPANEQELSKNEIPISLDVNGAIYANIGDGGIQNSAQEYLWSVLHNYITYNETISLNILPIYWLEPNWCIRVSDEKTNIEGLYSINSFSIPLTSNGSMTLSCSKLLQMINPNK